MNSSPPVEEKSQTELKKKVVELKYNKKKTVKGKSKRKEDK